MRRGFVIVALMAGLIGPAKAFDFEPVKPLDTKGVEPAMLANTFGAWEIRDKSGKKRCRVTLKQEFGIGGYQIEVAPGCEKSFPVTGDISAWRLLEGWTIDLVDPLRKTRVRFETPDDRYVALGDPKDIAGIYEIVKVKDTKGEGGPRKP
ncbi:MAG: AprI/Inh family metalloprotease inhibitor [Pseudolabrys sp.]|nr:AprI/Inh family metalloprotease inhibitor [Pseudolabrys sp.]